MNEYIPIIIEKASGFKDDLYTKGKWWPRNVFPIIDGGAGGGWGGINKEYDI